LDVGRPLTGSQQVEIVEEFAEVYDFHKKMGEGSSQSLRKTSRPM
jgi:hypothetical protein